MGTETGPSYANLLVGFIAHQVFIQYHGHKPELSGRYIDDYIGATSSTREELIQFTTAANSFHPALKPYAISNKHIYRARKLCALSIFPPQTR